MTDEQFWDIADTYEAEDREGQPYVPAKDIKKLVRSIYEANNYDYDESLADLSLFEFKVDSSRAEKYLEKISNNYLQTVRNVI